jgi:superfamily II DNA or RNA helicase
MNAIKLLLKRNPDAFVLISVPTEVLKEQWLENIIHEDLLLNCKVEIINTIITHKYDVDLLIIDEIHGTASECFRQIFNAVTYKLILGLTATLERLDGKEEIIKQYCPVVDEVSLQEAAKNGWVSPVKEYLVLLDVDLTEYKEWNQKFIGFFSYMNYDFNLAMKLATNAIERNKYARQVGVKPKEMAGIAYG